VAIQKGGVDRVGFESGNESSGFAIASAPGAMMLQQDLSVLLLAPAQCTANRIESE